MLIVYRGSAWSTTEKCPLNVCCSKFGFCGVTSEFCGSATVRSPSCSASSNSAAERIIGYYEGWSTTRSCGGLFPEVYRVLFAHSEFWTANSLTQDLRYDLYTHLNYAFAFVDPNTFAVAPMQDLDTQLYPRFTALKQQNPGLQTWISIGGWSMVCYTTHRRVCALLKMNRMILTSQLPKLSPHLQVRPRRRMHSSSLW